MSKKNINFRTTRFNEADWYSPGLNVCIGGLGGIGSYLAYFLSRQEAKIVSYEFDTIEEHNLGGQFYRTNQIGKTKQEACNQIINEFSNTSLINLGEFKKDSSVYPITFSAFDNMKARRMMFEEWKKLENREIFIDGRMNAEQGQVFSVTKGREKEYEATLFDDSELEDLPCNYKATSHCGAMIASLMTSSLNNYISNKKTSINLREIPFEIHYVLQLFDFKLKNENIPQKQE